jgi:hypothetical protein
MSVRPHGTTRLPIDGFSWSLIFGYLSKTCRNIQISLKSNTNSGCFARTPIYIFYHISLNSSENGKYFRQICRENQNTNFVFSNIFFRKLCRLWDNVEKYFNAGQATDDKIAHAHCMLCTYVYKHTLRKCNTYCFSTATMVAGTPLTVTLYVITKYFKITSKSGLSPRTFYEY